MFCRIVRAHLVASERNTLITLCVYCRPDVAPFARHVAEVFNVRSKEMDTPYLRLALLLDPRFKDAVNSADKFPELLRLVSKAHVLARPMYNGHSSECVPQTLPLVAVPKHSLHFSTQALEIGKKRGYTKEQNLVLKDQLHSYKAGVVQPWSVALRQVTPKTVPAEFWVPLRGHARELVELALVLNSIVPHAAGVERMFSAMGWFQSGRRVNLGVGTTAKLTALKIHVDNQRKCVLSAIVCMRVGVRLPV